MWRNLFLFWRVVSNSKKILPNDIRGTGFTEIFDSQNLCKSSKFFQRIEEPWPAAPRGAAGARAGPTDLICWVFHPLEIIFFASSSAAPVRFEAKLRWIFAKIISSPSPKSPSRQ
jgi:hypothetical protein